MKREYHKWYSPNLQKEMELLVFGHAGTRVLFFPCRNGRFFDYEDWRVIESVRDKIEAGVFQFFCVDSVDAEGLYNIYIRPEDRILRHIQYENYIIEEVLPFTRNINPHISMISAGCSLGAFHAVNVAMKYPQYFSKVVGMSGRYDLTWSVGFFRDLFDGYRNENIYFNSPSQFMNNLADETILAQLKRLDIILVIGKEDAFLENNYYFSHILSSKGIKHQFYLWDEEAHKARYWRKMVPLYI
jgi:esterase/lipase superfamily enzyme